METKKTASRDKIRTMVGFALKSNKIEIGTDNILRKNSASEVVFVDVFLSKNALAKIIRGCQASGKVLISANFNTQFDSIRAGCKVFGLTDHNMCELVKAQLTDDNQNYLRLLGGGRLG